jgi:hypothetical protein
MKAAYMAVRFEIHKIINSICNKEELPEEWKEAIILPIYNKGDKTDCSNYRGISLWHLHTKSYPTSCCKGYLRMQRKLLWIISVDFDAAG